MRIRSPLLLSTAFLGACYTYQPLETTVPVPGQRVSAQLTDEGSRDLTAEIGPEILHVEGDVVQADSAGVDLDVQEIESYRGIRSDWHGEHVRLPRLAVAGMQQRRLSIGGTAVMTGAIGAGLYLIYRVVSGVSSSEGGTGQGGGQSQ
jgi:hypothetical protein